SDNLSASLLLNALTFGSCLMTETHNTAEAAVEGHASCCQGGTACGPGDTPRRGLLTQGRTALIRTALLAIPPTLGGLNFLAPILRKKQAATRRIARATGSASLTAGRMAFNRCFSSIVCFSHEAGSERESIQKE
ncbi:MAG: hypothetical protein RLZZ536_2889, partial [Planctomycetota bacterium]